MKDCVRLMMALICLMLLPLLDASATTTGQNWPEFRGPLGNGLVTQPGEERGFPLHWSESDNVVWKTEIPHQGWSTPVVMEGRVWLTTATTDGHEYFVLCLDAATGEILIHKKLFHADDPEPLGNEVNSYASPSPVAEPGRVFIHFGSYGTACLDAATGDVLWERDDLPCRHFRGPGSSAIVFENLLILTFDGADVQYLAALDKDTGATVWRTERSTDWPDLDEEGQPRLEGDFRKAFTTPLIVPRDDRFLLVSPGSYTVFAYDARTGEELWHAANDAYSPAPRPVFGGDLVYVVTGRGAAELWAMKVDGQGDVKDTHIAWTLSGRSIPSEPSPLLVGELLYLVSNNGQITCLEADTGEEIWNGRIGGNYLASPVYADGRLYIFNTQGRATVLREGRAFEEMAVNELDSGLLASPAAHQNAFILRTRTHLYRIASVSAASGTE